MRERRTLPPSVLMTLVALLLTPIAASAASGLPPTLSMEPPTAGPGESVAVSGTGFPAGAVIELELRTPTADRSLGPTLAEESGYFSTTVTLPADAEPGSWQLVAAAAEGQSASYAFNASPGDPDAAVAPVTSEPVEPALASGNSMTDIAVMLVVAVLIAAGIGAAGYVYYQVRLADRQPGMAIGDDPIWSGANKGDDPAATATDEPAWLHTPPDSPPAED